MGFRNLVIDPAVVGDLKSASGSYESPQGRVSTAWTKSDREYRLTVTVPPGSTAEVHVPQFRGGDDAVYHVGSGTHTFRSSIPRG